MIPFSIEIKASGQYPERIGSYESTIEYVKIFSGGTEIFTGTYETFKKSINGEAELSDLPDEAIWKEFVRRFGPNRSEP